MLSPLFLYVPRRKAVMFHFGEEKKRVTNLFEDLAPKHWPVIWMEFVYWITLCFLEFKWSECLIVLESRDERWSQDLREMVCPLTHSAAPLKLLSHLVLCLDSLSADLLSTLCLKLSSQGDWLCPPPSHGAACLSALAKHLSSNLLQNLLAMSFVYFLLPQVDCKPREGRARSIVPTVLWVLSRGTDACCWNASSNWFTAHVTVEMSHMLCLSSLSQPISVFRHHGLLFMHVIHIWGILQPWPWLLPGVLWNCYFFIPFPRTGGSAGRKVCGAESGLRQPLKQSE